MKLFREATCISDKQNLSVNRVFHVELKKQCKYNNLQKPNIKPCACADYVVWILQCFFPFVVFAFAFFVAFVCKSIVDLSMHSSTIGALYRMHCTSYGKLKPFYNKINMCEINAFSNTHTFPHHSLYYSSSVCYEYSNRRAKKTVSISSISRCTDLYSVSFFW